MTLSALGIFSAAGAGGAPAGAYELIQTHILSSAQPSVTFSNLNNFSSTYRHLQIRVVARGSSANDGVGLNSRLNGDTGNNYNAHFLFGNGSSVSSGVVGVGSSALTGLIMASTSTANSFGAVVIDLLDPYSSTKNKTFRTLSGSHGTGQTRIDLHSALWMNTASLTSWQVFPALGDFVIGSRISLYGIRG